MGRILWSLVASAIIAGGGVGLWLSGFFGLLFAVPIALVVAIFAGAPTFFWLRKLGWLSWWQLMSAGAVLALPVAAGALPNVATFGILAASGAAGGLLFWYLGIWPNESFKPSRLGGWA